MMDEKHRQYCIRLGNPYMQNDKYNKENLNQVSEPWIPVMNDVPEDWQNNKKYNN